MSFNWTNEIEAACSDLGIGEGGDPNSNPEGKEFVRASTGTSTTADHSPALDTVHIDSIVDAIPLFGGWQSQLAFSRVSKLGGKIALADEAGIVLQPGAENDEPSAAPYKDDWSNRTYNTQKLTGEFAFTREDMKKVRDSGLDLSTWILQRLSKVLANNLGELNLNGNENIANPDASRLNKLLSRNDGMMQLVRDNGEHNLYPSTTTGKEFDVTMYDSMYQRMPKQYRHAQNLVWFQGSAIDSAYMSHFRNVKPSGTGNGSQGSALGDRAASARHARQLGGLYGVSPIIIPQMNDDEAGSIGVVTPTSAANVSDNVKVVVNTIAATTLAGRTVKVRMKTTGVEATGTVVFTGGNNEVTITGTMGQVTISTTASDYEVSLADLTSVMLTVPQNFHVLFHDDIRAYHRFDQRRERFLFTIHFEHDVILHLPDAVVLAEGLITPRATFFD